MLVGGRGKIAHLKLASAPDKTVNLNDWIPGKRNLRSTDRGNRASLIGRPGRKLPLAKGKAKGTVTNYRDKKAQRAIRKVKLNQNQDNLHRITNPVPLVMEGKHSKTRNNLNTDQQTNRLSIKRILHQLNSNINNKRKKGLKKCQKPSQRNPVKPTRRRST